MYSLSVKGPEKFVQSMKRQANFATQRSINDGLFRAHAAVKSSMKQYIEGGPIQFTERGMRVKKAGLRNLYGKVYFQENRFYMREIIFGGQKEARNKKIPEPGNRNFGALTAKGNYRRNYLNKLFKSAGYTDQGAEGTIYGKPKRKGAPGISIGKSKNGVNGIWEWQGKGESRKPKLLVALERPNRPQRVTFPANKIAHKAFQREFSQSFKKNLKKAIKTMRM